MQYNDNSKWGLCEDHELVFRHKYSYYFIEFSLCLGIFPGLTVITWLYKISKLMNWFDMKQEWDYVAWLIAHISSFSTWSALCDVEKLVYNEL